VKYARATLWIFYGWALRKLHMPRRWVHEVEDRASIEMFDCSLDFEPVETVAPVGWYCKHFSMTSSGVIPTAPTSSLCNCTMQPILG
jgi:hypothetical protein